MRVMLLVFEKKNILFSNDVYSGKNFFSRFGFSLQFYFSKKKFKCVHFTFESCWSLIMALGSQLKVKTNSYIILIVLALCFIINIPYHLNMQFKLSICCFTFE